MEMKIQFENGNNSLFKIKRKIMKIKKDHENKERS